MGDLAAVRHLDATEAVRGGELHAALQVTVGGKHAAARVLGVAEPTARLRLEFRGAQLVREL
jgi:hypothetical protein